MDERNEEKGFKVVDKRSMSDEEREAGRKPTTATPPAPEARPAPGAPEAPPAETGGDAQAGLDAAAAVAAEGYAAMKGHGRPPGVAPPGFTDLLQSLQFSAMISLGMVQDPDGKRSPVDLPAAHDAIDMLGVLKEKTRGNLTAEEDGMLTEGLYVLRMSYIAAMNAAKPKP
jgi:hypothetical protein